MKLYYFLFIFQCVNGFISNNCIMNNKYFKNIDMRTSYESNYKNSKIIQGDSLQTWSFLNHPNSLKVKLNSEGRPYDAEIKLWQGPNNTPFKLRVYSENGYDRSFFTIIETHNNKNTICVSNIQDITFPFEASVVTSNTHLSNFDYNIPVQGNSLKTFLFNCITNRVHVLINTDGRPLNCRIEILQGPDSIKQIIEIYSEDGYYRPFFGILETPGYENVINVINTASVEFPLFVSVLPN